MLEKPRIRWARLNLAILFIILNIIKLPSAAYGKLLIRRRQLTKYVFFRAKTQRTRARANVETSRGFENLARPNSRII